MNQPLEHHPAGPVVRVRGLTKTYGDRTVVNNIDLDVPAGGVVGLIGANGAGKTTTVECLQGLRRPDAGQVEVLGLDPMAQADALRQQVGSQLQDSALPDRLRVSEAIDLFSTARARDAEVLLERFGLAHRRRYFFGAMSGGERQRLFLVLALLNRPRLVILDELTQGLDPSARREVWAAVQRLHDEGTTVLLVTHELDEAEALCDRVVAMRAGEILDAGTPMQLVARHAGRVTVSFGPAHAPDDAAEALRRLPGVDDVVCERGRVAVHGDRTAIAHVGAWLTRLDRVPPDLDVDVPDLEDALLNLLDTPPDPAQAPPRELIGASR